MTLRFALASTIAALSLGATMAAAQAPAAPTPDDAVAAAKNQLGVLEYCQKAGHIDATAVESQQKMIALLPPATDTAKVDAAYEKGQSGVVSVMGTEQKLADAPASGTDEATICKQLGDIVAQAAAQLPK